MDARPKPVRVLACPHVEGPYALPRESEPWPLPAFVLALERPTERVRIELCAGCLARGTQEATEAQDELLPRAEVAARAAELAARLKLAPERPDASALFLAFNTLLVHARGYELDARKANAASDRETFRAAAVDLRRVASWIEAFHPDGPRDPREDG